MGTYGSASVAFILSGGYSLLGDSIELSDKIEALTDESMSLGDSWPEPSAVGVSRADLTQRGYFNDTALALNAALVEAQGTSRVFCYGVEGNTAGKHFTGYAGALEAQVERIATLGKLHRVNVSYRGNGAVEQGFIHQALAAVTVDFDTTSAGYIDNAASSASGGSGYVQVSAYSGFTNVIVKLRHSTDHVSWSDLITFATITSAPTAERKTVAGTINRYTAVDVNVTGSGSITLMIGLARN